ncbi:hypothetical protein [Chloroflexus sp.]|uniref:hypothetical protein n=1 Tax=Chloroflexus sp. TaxID=1904827 RepID=UPI004049469F
MARGQIRPLLNTEQNTQIDCPQVWVTVLSPGRQSDVLGQLAGGLPLGAIGNRSLRAAFVTSAILLAPNLWLLRGRPTLEAVPVLEPAEPVDG